MWEKWGLSREGEHQRVSQDQWTTAEEKWDKMLPQQGLLGAVVVGFLSPDGPGRFWRPWKVQGTGSFSTEGCLESCDFITTVLSLTLFLPDKGLKKKEATAFVKLPFCKVCIHKKKTRKSGYWLVLFWQMIYFPNKFIFLKSQAFSR